MSSASHPSQAPEGLIWAGAIFLLVAAIAVSVGKIPVRFGGVVDRSKNSSDFWWCVATCFLCGIFLIGSYLYETGAFSF
jgi:hypothetical protein